MTAPKRRGTVLVLVLVVVAILSVVAISTMFMMRSEKGAAAAAERKMLARAAAMSGIHRAIASLITPPPDGSGVQDNPTLFRAQPIADGDWCFTVYADAVGDSDEPAYGVQDEAARVNLNVADEQMLLALPGMTEPLVHCLLDFRDSDNEAHPQGAEQDPAGEGGDYFVKNAPLSTPEELLLVKGFDGGIVYGTDANLNGLVEPNEADGDESFPPNKTGREPGPGLRPYVTTVSYDPDLDSEGGPRININEGSGNDLRDKLTAAGIDRGVANFIVAARAANVRFLDPSQLLEMQLELPVPNRRNRTVRMSSGVNADRLPAVMDKLTCGGLSLPNGQKGLIGRINVSSASQAVLAAMGGLGENGAQRILDARDSLDPDRLANTAWLYTDAGLSAEQFKQVAPLATARSYQYRVRSFGYSMAHGTFCVLEAIIDLAGSEPRIVYLRDLTRLGAPLPVTSPER